MPALAGFETQRQGGIKPLLAGGPAAIQSLDITRFAAEGDLAFRGFADQLAPKQRHVRGGRIRREDRCRGRKVWSVRSK